MAKSDKPVVLVADDEPSTLALVATHLRGRGYQVIEATDGDEAWNIACRELPDLVVLDVMMPGMSGWEVCRKIREAVSLAHTGVVMLTGIGDTLNELTSPLYGADAYLDKPFQFTKLAALVETTLKQRTGGNLGRPKKTSGPSTRLYKTALSEEESPKPKAPAQGAKAVKKPVAKKAKKKAALKKAAKKTAKKAAVKKAAPKKAAKKAGNKKTVKKAAKKTVKKSAAKKTGSKKAVKKAVKKATLQKAAKKSAAKKAKKKAARKR